MQVSVIAGAKHTQHSGARKSMPYELYDKRHHAERHTQDMLRYLILVIALVAVFVLIAIVLYYTQANSVPIEHISSLASQFALRA